MSPFSGIEQRSPYHLLRDLVVGQRLLVEDPLILVAAGVAFELRSKPALRSLENCGTIPVYWRANGTAGAGSFHGILKACAAQDDGTGGFVDLSRFEGTIYIAPTSGSVCRVVRFQAIAPEGQS